MGLSGFKKLSRYLTQSDDKFVTNLDDLLETGLESGAIACIDWREETTQSIAAIDQMLEIRGKLKLNWSFFDILKDADVGEIFRNKNFLSLTRDQLAQHNLVLCRIQTYDDSYCFSILSEQEFNEIESIEHKDQFLITKDYDADEFYLQAIRLLEQAEMDGKLESSVYITEHKQSKSRNKKKNRKLETLKKQLGDENGGNGFYGDDEKLPKFSDLDGPIKAGNGHNYNAYSRLSNYATFRIRNSIFNIIHGKSNSARALRDGWYVNFYAALFRERAYLEDLSEFSSFSDYSEEYSTYLPPTQAWDFAYSIFGLYWLGENETWRNFAKLFTIYKSRDDIEGCFETIIYSLISLLSIKQLDTERLNDILNEEPLKGLKESWECDKAFEEKLNQLCEWHIDHCHASKGYKIHSPGFDLFPTWILALDKYRALQRGCSCLPTNDLMSLTKLIMDADFGEPKTPLFTETSRVYQNCYGDDNSDIRQSWLEFLAGYDMDT